MKKIIIFLALMPGIAFADTSKALFLKEKLITTPKEQAASKENVIKKLIPAVTLPILFDWCLIKGFKHGLLWFFEKLQAHPIAQHPDAQAQIANFTTSIKTVTTNYCPNFIPELRSLLIYYITHKIILSRLENKQFLQFIKEWETNKKYTPKEFHYSFEGLYAAYEQNNRLDKKKVNQLKVKIRRLVQYHSTKGG